MSSSEGEAPSDLRVLEVTKNWAIGEYGRCLAVVWSGQPDPHAMQRRADHLVDLCKRHPGHCALVEVVEPTSKPPDDNTRRVAMEVFRKLGNDLSGIAFVVEGNEVRTTLTRAIITGMLFFVRQPQPSKVFKRIPDLAAWVRGRIHAEDSEFNTKLAAAFEHLRGLMHAVP